MKPRSQGRDGQRGTELKANHISDAQDVIERIAAKDLELQFASAIDVGPKMSAAHGQKISSPAADEKALDRCAAAINKAMRKGVDLIFEVGRNLKIAHDLLANHGDGEFGRWCVEHCGMCRSTAHEYLRVFKTFGDAKGKVCPPGGQSRFDVKALYKLARDGMPPAAIKEALATADRGERVSLKLANEIVRKHTAESISTNESQSNFGRWDLRSFEKQLRMEAMQWWRMCPPKERSSFVLRLRELADELDRIANAEGSAA